MSARARLRFWAFGLVLAACLAAFDARAADAPRIAVVHDPSADERAIGRLRAELTTLGLEVVDVTLASAQSEPAVDDAARNVDAFAAIHVVPARGGVEVWVADRVTGKTLLRELVVGPRGTFDDVVALQAVELLRARLAELGLSPRPIERIVGSPRAERVPPRPRPVRRAERRLLLQLGPDLMTSPGALGTTAGAFVGVRWRATSALGLDLWSVLPIAPSSVETQVGSADVRPYLFGVGAAAWLFEPDANWQVMAAAGIAVAHLAIDGRARPPLLSRTDSSTVAMPYARFSLERRLNARFGIGLDGFVGVATPHPIIRFDGRRVADWGRPAVSGVLSLDVALD